MLKTKGIIQYFKSEFGAIEIELTIFLGMVKWNDKDNIVFRACIDSDYTIIKKECDYYTFREAFKRPKNFRELKRSVKKAMQNINIQESNYKETQAYRDSVNRQKVWDILEKLTDEIK